jgi:uncharacterized SAM-binding protein YcdF (DUF218 family)
MVETRTDPGTGAAAPPPRRGDARTWLRSLARAAIAIGVILALAIGLGFWRFATHLPADEVVLDRNADGIVVLTGGASRISDAIELLAAGRGRRLLISGLNRATTAEEISRLNPEFGQLMRCCIDFDRSLNTLGNAIETRHWAQDHGFRSLIVVTSNYHMPRAIAEIAHQLPGVALLPFPVVTDRERSESWWARGPMLRLMLSEYLKYMYAQVRIRLDRTAGERSVGV